LPQARGDPQRLSHAPSEVSLCQRTSKRQIRSGLSCRHAPARDVGIVVAHVPDMSRARGATGVLALWANRELGEELNVSSHHHLVEVLEAAARSAPLEHLPDLIAQVEALKARLYARLTSSSPAPAARDRLLNVKEAAQKLGRSSDWLYRHGSELSFVVRDGRLLRFSEQGIEEYIKRRMAH
jgi:predicted DNA-binding transcriptional regulator AlpA